ncbi:hypothetical protein D1872_261090 [compost metagenome]
MSCSAVNLAINTPPLRRFAPILRPSKTQELRFLHDFMRLDRETTTEPHPPRTRIPLSVLTVGCAVHERKQLLNVPERFFQRNPSVLLFVVKRHIYYTNKKGAAAGLAATPSWIFFFE